MIEYGNRRLRKYDSLNIVIEKFVTNEVPKQFRKEGQAKTNSKWVVEGYYPRMHCALKAWADKLGEEALENSFTMPQLLEEFEEKIEGLYSAVEDVRTEHLQ